MKSIEIIKTLILFLVFVVCASGCYTANKSHNFAHNRAIKEDLRLLHKDVDSFLGTAESSMLSE